LTASVSSNVAASTSSYGAGVLRPAFAAADRAVVDRAHELAVAAGAEILDPPQVFDYEPGYYATFFRDPNGFKLEVVTRIQPGPAAP
jgi:catechol 2,3-dioxygenase-like lactoylglutathione lyase family enzyme